MKKVLYIILIILVVVFVAIQFVPAHMPESKEDQTGDIVHSGMVMDDIAALLKNSCYDCHSNETHFPWYAKVAPSSWLLSSDVREGRSKLNFSEWQNYSKRRQIGKLESIKEELKAGDMPLKTYTFIHRKAKLTPEQVSILVHWTDDMTNKILE